MLTVGRVHLVYRHWLIVIFEVPSRSNFSSPGSSHNRLQNAIIHLRKAIDQYNHRWYRYSRMVRVGTNQLSSLFTECYAQCLLTVGDHSNGTIRSTSGVIGQIVTQHNIPHSLNHHQYHHWSNRAWYIWCINIGDIEGSYHVLLHVLDVDDSVSDSTLQEDLGHRPIS